MPVSLTAAVDADTDEAVAIFHDEEVRLLGAAEWSPSEICSALVQTGWPQRVW